MSNAERIAKTRQEEYGYNEFEENDWSLYRTVKVKVHGKIYVYKPRREVE